MDGFLILTLLTGFVGSIAFVVFIGKRPFPKISLDGEFSDGLLLSGCHQPQFFSPTERSFYEILRRLTPEHTVFAKVRVADLVSVRASVSPQSHLNGIDRKHIDFVVCDRNLVPVVAVELDDALRARSDLRPHDKYIEKVLAAASLPVIYVPARHGYVLDEIHRLLSPYLRIGTLTL
jgi:hypothetical protein